MKRKPNPCFIIRERQEMPPSRRKRPLNDAMYSPTSGRALPPFSENEWEKVEEGIRDKAWDGKAWGRGKQQGTSSSGSWGGSCSWVQSREARKDTIYRRYGGKSREGKTHENGKKGDIRGIKVLPLEKILVLGGGFA